jgi:tetratricopeptide (TPR) repeat protein
MSDLQSQYDEAMLQFSQGDYPGCIGRLKGILAADAAHFDAQLALGMAYYRLGDYAAALEEGHKAERMRPHEQLVHTNLSLFYLKAGNKAAAEHHGLQARISSWRAEAQQAKTTSSEPPREPELELARPAPKPVRLPGKFPDMPWKKKAPGGGNGPASGASSSSGGA